MVVFTNVMLVEMIMITYMVPKSKKVILTEYYRQIRIATLCFKLLPLEPQPITVFVNDCKHLSQLELTDSHNDSSSQVNILIASSYFWKLITGKIWCSNTGPVAISTKLGWALSGPGSLLPTQLSATRVLLPPTVTHIQIVEAKPLNNLNLNEILCFFEN